MLTITNAFSIQMLSNLLSMVGDSQFVTIRRIGLAEAKRLVSGEFEMVGVPEPVKAVFRSAIGHADTARVMTGLLGVEIPMNRVSITSKEFPLLVGQLVGGRLPEGATTLPEGAEIQWFLVDLV